MQSIFAPSTDIATRPWQASFWRCPVVRAGRTLHLPSLRGHQGPASPTKCVRSIGECLGSRARPAGACRVESINVAVALTPAATSPGRAATAAAPAATAATAASPPAPATTCASAPTTPPVGHLYAILERSVILLVEDVEGRQTDVGNLFLTEEEFVMRCAILHRHAASASGEISIGGSSFGGAFKTLLIASSANLLILAKSS